MDKNRESTIWKRIQEELSAVGIDLSKIGSELQDAVKVVCVHADLNDSVVEMSKAHRDQVVMVRVDEETSQSLDAWVKTEAVKSRSEAAALFIREGLRVRADELEALQGALDEVDQAKDRLKRKVREVFSGGENAEEGAG